MGFFSFLKYTFIIFAAHLDTSCGAPFENHWCRVFLETSAVAQLYMEPEGSLPCPQQRITGPHPETAECSPNPLIRLIEDYCLHYPSIYA
jgi:hypothetical protein